MEQIDEEKLGGNTMLGVRLDDHTDVRFLRSLRHEVRELSKK